MWNPSACRSCSTLQGGIDVCNPVGEGRGGLHCKGRKQAPSNICLFDTVYVQCLLRQDKVAGASCTVAPRHADTSLRSLGKHSTLDITPKQHFMSTHPERHGYGCKMTSKRKLTPQGAACAHGAASLKATVWHSRCPVPGPTHPYGRIALGANWGPLCPYKRPRLAWLTGAFGALALRFPPVPSRAPCARMRVCVCAKGRIPIMLKLRGSTDLHFYRCCKP